MFADVNECVNDPCVHGTCENTHGSYVCVCDGGYTGVHCETGLYSFHMYFHMGRTFVSVMEDTQGCIVKQVCIHFVHDIITTDRLTIPCGSTSP